MSLAERNPIPHREISGPLSAAELGRAQDELGPQWTVVDGKKLEREFKFDDFRGALEFVYAVADLAEEIDHHPDLCFGWGYCRISIWTHKVDGLSINDFILAARAEALAT